MVTNAHQTSATAKAASSERVRKARGRSEGRRAEIRTCAEDDLPAHFGSVEGGLVHCCSMKYPVWQQCVVMPSWEDTSEPHMCRPCSHHV